MTPSDTVSIDSDGSMGEIVFHPYGMPIHHTRMCNSSNACTAINTHIL